MTPQELAGHAADILRERGHCKHLLLDACGHVCAVGALNVAASGNAYNSCTSAVQVSQAMNLVDAAMQAIDPDRGWLVEWNNHPDTTADEVIAAFELAAGRTPEVAVEVEEREPVLA